MKNAFDIVMLGHFAKDRIVCRNEASVAAGGAVYYGSVALTRLGHNVAVITKLRKDEFRLLDELSEEGITVFASEALETSGIENVYATVDCDKRVCHPLGFAGAFTSEEVPDVEAKVLLVVPILSGEVDLPLLQTLSQRARIGLDAQGFVRIAEDNEVVFRDWEEKREGLSSVEFLKVDDTEAEVLTGTADRREAAATLAAFGPKEVVLTHGKGVLVYSNDCFHEASFAPQKIVGRTGRGDTCFAVYVARRLSSEPEEAVRFAAAATSLKMETPGPFRDSVNSVQAMLGNVR